VGGLSPPSPPFRIFSPSEHAPWKIPCSARPDQIHSGTLYPSLRFLLLGHACSLSAYGVAMVAADWKVLAPLYAAAISTIALGWNIISTRAARKAELRVSLHFGMRFPGDLEGNPLGPRTATLKVGIVNSGSTVRYVLRPGLRLSRAVAGHKYADRMELGEKFPYKLEPGETFEQTLSLAEIEQELLVHMRERDSICATVRDTVGISYRSPGLRVGSIRKFMASVKAHDPFLTAALET
jgi:hypothetical protein